MTDTSENTPVKRLYTLLHDRYRPQGWWPLLDESGEPHYHPEDYSLPSTSKQQFEIIIGSILTQNTSWKQVEKSLKALHSLKATEPEHLLVLSDKTLKEAIRYSGYYNQKAQRLQMMARWFLQADETPPSREELLSLNGVGPETADSILLYAYKQPYFVIDTYTKRVMVALGFCSANVAYDKLKRLFESQLPTDTVIFQEFHALLVAHAKRYHQPSSSDTDPLVHTFSE